MLLGGLAYTVWLALRVRPGWVGVSDMWNSGTVALAIFHGHVSAMYGGSSQVISPPGLEVLLAPFLGIGQLLGLHPPWNGVPATLGFVLFPVAIFAASTLLFAIDAYARSWNMSAAQRGVLAMVGAIGVISDVMFWGHPEDCVALAFVLWAAQLVDRQGIGGYNRAGWLLGIAVAFQPLALLGIAPIVARFGIRRLPKQAFRIAIPSAVLVLPPLIVSNRHTLHAIVGQPYVPRDESFTPFSKLAPSLGHGAYSGGPIRLIVTLAAFAIGYVVCRRRHDVETVLLMIVAGCMLRVLFETELLGFYFLPVTAICLLVAMRQSRGRFLACAIGSTVCIILGNRREHSISVWWPSIMATAVLLLLIVAIPVVARHRAPRDVRRSSWSPQEREPLAPFGAS
jgi:hypothetical protein